MLKELKFPDGFIFGSAASGHQIEGNNKHSDWWHWELASPAQPLSGKAVDYWNRFEEDHALMASMGHQAFRLGIEWARIEPKPGEFDADAVAHYHRILKSLQSHGIKICLTLHHWVLPKWVADEKDWRNPKTVEWFLRYTDFVIREFGEYPAQWITLNEPMVAALAGYFSADFPPGRRNYFELRTVVRHMLTAHAGAYQQIHQYDPDAQVGVAMAYPLLETWGSKGFAGWYERMTVAISRRFVFLGWDQSVKTGRLHALYGRGEINGLRESADFCGINYYFRMTLRFSLRHWRTGFIDQEATPSGVDKNDFGWQIWPEGIHTIISEIWSRFRKPIYITENGIADASDEKRGPYITEHLKQVHRAIEDGVPVLGYYHWSFIDNFEWKEGFEMKFGLVEVDPEDPELARKPRPSAALYSRIIQHHGIPEK